MYTSREHSCTSILADKLSFCLIIYLGRKLLGHSIYICLASVDTVKHISSETEPILTLTSSIWVFSCSAPLPHFMLWSPFHFSHSDEGLLLSCIFLYFAITWWLTILNNCSYTYSTFITFHKGPEFIFLFPSFIDI